MKTDIDELTSDLPEGGDPLTYYHELDDTLYSVTSDTFIGQVYSLADLESIADAVDDDAGGYPQLSAEHLVQSDPDLIFLADAECCQQSAETLAARPGFADLTAIKEGNVVELDEDIASRWGPRVVDLLETIIDAVRSSGVAAMAVAERALGGTASSILPARARIAWQWWLAGRRRRRRRGGRRDRVRRGRHLTARGRCGDARPHARCRHRLRPDRARGGDRVGDPVPARDPGAPRGGDAVRRRARRTRARSATRSPTRGCSELRRAPGSASRSRSSPAPPLGRRRCGSRSRRSSARSAPSRSRTHSVPPAAARA